MQTSWRNKTQGNSHIAIKIAHGFTLIEMMAVMVLLGLLTGIIIPSFERWFESTEDRVAKTAIANSLQKLLTRSALLEQDFELTEKTVNSKMSDGEPAMQLPPGWSLAPEQSLKIWRSGKCDKSTINFTKKNSKIVLQIEEESCFVSTAAPHQQ